MSIFKDGEVRFPDVVLIPIIAISVVGIIFISVMFWHIGYDDGKDYMSKRIANECDHAYGSFDYRTDDGSTYNFDCSFKGKSEKKPWEGAY